MSSPSITDRPPLSKKALPPNKRIQKRPLLHPPIHAPLHTSQDRVVYISASMPFVSAVKRVEGFLASKAGAGEGHEVVLKATGRAIDRALQVGCYFMERESERVVVKTGTVEVVDDVVEKVDYREPRDGKMKEVEDNNGERKKRKRGKGGSEGVGKSEVVEKSEAEEEGGHEDMEMGGVKEEEDAEEDMLMKFRKTSMVEIIISSTGGG